MTKVIKNFVLVVLILKCLIVFGQDNYRFDHLTVEDGLSQNSVNYIFQDKDGFIWLGTQDGLNKYDGYKFTHYRNEINNPTSLSDNFVLTIDQDSAGNIWCTTRDGVNCLDPVTNKNIRFYNDTNITTNQAYKVYFGKDGVEIFFPNIIYTIPNTIRFEGPRVQLSQNRYVQATPNKDEIYNKQTTIQGDVIVVGYAGLMVNERLYSLDSIYHCLWNMSNALFCAKNGDIWIGNDKGLFKWIRKKKQLEVFKAPLKVMTIEEDVYGKIWVGTSQGIYIINNNEVVDHLISDVKNDKGISYNFVQHIFKDRSGLMWVGTPNTGLDIYDYKKEQFKYLNFSHGLTGKVIWSIYQGENSDYLIGTGEGLYRMELKPGASFTDFDFAYKAVDTIYKMFPSHPALGSGKITAISETTSDYYVGTSLQGLYKVAKNSRSVSPVDIKAKTPYDNTISNVMVHRNALWVTTFRGFYQLSLDGVLIKSYFSDPENPTSVSASYFMSMYRTKQGKTWLGSNNGFSEYISETDEFVNYPYSKKTRNNRVNSQFVSGFVHQPDHGLWVATFGGGLNLLNKKGTFEYYTENEGLTNNVICAIEEDGNHHLWMSTNKGLSRFDSETRTVINYTTNNGLIFNEFALNSFFKNKSGELLFGTADGIVIFNPQQIQEPRTTEPPVVSALKVNYKDVQLPVQKGETFQKLDLYHADKVLSIEITALNYRAPKDIQYRYKLEGFNDNWILSDAGNRVINYSNLPYGDYVLKIKSTNELGTWSEVVKEITIVVHPPFWLTWWFISMEGLILIVIIVLVVRYFAQRKLKKQLRAIEIQQKIHEERIRISRDLHDNIGAQLTFIISSVDNIKYLFKSPDQKVKEKLTTISNFTRTTITQLRDTIWALNKDEIYFEDLKSRLYNYIENANLAQENTTFAFHSDVESNLYLNPIQGVCTYRIVQEAINNAIKYAAATKVELNITETESTVILFIEDDGIGFKMNEVKLGNGLENMNNRAKAINAELNIESTHNRGTKISLILNKNQLNAV